MSSRTPRVTFLVLIAASTPMRAQDASSVDELAAKIRDHADPVAVRELDRLAAGQGELASRAQKAQKYVVASTCDKLEAIAALEAGSLQALAAAEVARLRARDSQWPIADIRRIEVWQRKKIEAIEKAIAQDRKWNADRPNRIYDERIARAAKQLKEVRALSLRAAALQLLGEYYEASRQTAAAVRAVVAHAELAEAAKNLPTVTIERQSGRVDRSGEMMVESTEEYEVDVGKWAAAFFNMASAQSAVDAKFARELAAQDREVLTRLADDTVNTLKLAYAKRIAAEVKARERRIEETKRRNRRTKR